MDIKKNIFILTGAGISKESGIETLEKKMDCGTTITLKMYALLMLF